MSTSYWRTGTAYWRTLGTFVRGWPSAAVYRLPLPLAAATAQPCVPTAHCPTWQAPVLRAPRRHQGRA